MLPPLCSAFAPGQVLNPCAQDAVTELMVSTAALVQQSPGGLVATQHRQGEITGVKAGLSRKNGWYEEAGDKSGLESCEQFLLVQQALLCLFKRRFRWGFGDCWGTWATAVSYPGMHPFSRLQVSSSWPQ